jgi:hypothetical protein
MGTRTSASAVLVWFVAVCCGLSGLASNCFAELPDSPGTTQSQAVARESSPDTALLAQAAANPSPAQQSDTPQSGNQTRESQTPSGQRPVGTAAAGSVPTTGVAASQPAGNAIAPGKQRRVHSLVFKVGALIGAGVAVGTVAALTVGTSSKPPGAR